jgi:hypothetical protein
MMKTNPTFNFVDEPQFRTFMGRAEAANRLWSYRNKENGNKKRFTVKKTHNGYFVALRYSGSPVAFIGTK